MKTSLLATSAFALCLSATFAEARTSTDAEFRGYQQCVNAADRESRGLVPSRNYYLDKGETSLYYVNATRWEEGERAAVRVACETDLRGHRLLSANVSPGHFTLDRTGSVTIDIAQK